MQRWLRERECNVRHMGLSKDTVKWISKMILRRVCGRTYRSPDETGVGCGNNDSQCNSTLFLGLTTGGSNPSENDGVNSICTNGEDDHADISRSGVVNCEAEDETENCNALCAGDVPSSLVVSSGRPRPVNGDDTSDEVWWAGQSKCDGTVETKTGNDRGEEVLESVGGQVHVLHEDEDPDAVIGKSFLKTLDGGDLALLVDGILADSLSCENALFGCEPAGDTWVIWEEMCSDNGNDKSGNSLNDEEPSPSFQACDTVHLEDDDSDKTSESGG